MLRRSIKIAWFERSRYALTLAAITFGVAFVVATLTLTGSLEGRGDLVAEAHAELGSVVLGEELGTEFGGPADGEIVFRAPIPPAATAALEDASVPSSPVWETYGQIVGADGKAAGQDLAVDNILSNWIDGSLNPYVVDSGAAPVAPGSAVVDVADADDAGLQVGDTIAIVTAEGVVERTLAGLVRYGDAPGPPRQTVVLVADDDPLLSTAVITRILVAADESVAQPALAGQPVEVVSADSWFSTEKARIDSDLSFFSVFLTIFAVVSIVVGAVVVANTFSVSAAQRSRELALLRLVGSTPGQLRRQLFVEAVILGTIGTLLGVVLSRMLVGGLGAVLGLLGGSSFERTGDPGLTPVVVGLFVGLGVTIVSSWWPNRRASRVSPIEALTVADVEPAAPPRRKTVFGVVLFIAGMAATTAGALIPSIPASGFGLLLLLVSAFMLGAYLMRFAALVASPITRRLGPPGMIASRNASRYATRTASSAGSLLIGFALVVFFTIQAATVSAFVVGSTADSVRAENVVKSVGTIIQPSVPAAAVASVRAVPGVDVAAPVYAVNTAVNDAITQVGAVGGGNIEAVYDAAVTEGSLDDLGATTVAVHRGFADEAGIELGGVASVRTPFGPADFEVVAIYDNLLPWFESPKLLFTPETLFAGGVPDLAQYVLISGNVTTDELASAIADAPTIEAVTKAEFLDSLGNLFAEFLNLVYALLAISVVIALVGIANTVSLSINERRGEIATVKAVGSTGRQVFTGLVTEFTMVAVVGVVVGTVLAIGGSIAFFRGIGAGIALPTIPVGVIAVLMLAGVAAGSAASWWPAARAARAPLLETLQREST
jgi:putative ABC transport system permease protein